MNPTFNIVDDNYDNHLFAIEYDELAWKFLKERTSKEQQRAYIKEQFYKQLPKLLDKVESWIYHYKG